MKYKKEDLEKLIILENKSYELIGRLYGVSGAAIRKAANRFELNIPCRRIVNPSETFNKGILTKSKIINCSFCNVEFLKYPSHKGKFCSHDCQHKKQYTDYIIRWKNGEETGLCIDGYTLSKNIRKYLFDKNNSKCEKCRWCEININTGLIPLQVHHVDGDCKNNIEYNLQLLCPNCHSLTNNFGSKNKNAANGRSEYFGRSKKIK